MKKGLMTFCTVALLATQVSTANAASNKEEAAKVNCGDTFQNSVVQKVDLNWLEQLKNSNINFKIDNEETLKQYVNQYVNQFVKQGENYNNYGDYYIKQPVKHHVNQDQNEPTKQPVNQGQNEPTRQPVNQGQNQPTKQPVKQDNNQQTEKPVVQKPTTPAPQVPSNEQNATNNNQSTTAQSSVDQIEAAVVDLTNKERAKVGLAPLKMDSALMAVAREKSQDMRDKNYFSHTSPTFGSPFDRLKALGISYSAAGENIAKGQRSAEEVVAAWMASQGHRENILNPNYTHIGVGYVKEGNIWTQEFIKK